MALPTLLYFSRVAKTQQGDYPKRWVGVNLGAAMLRDIERISILLATRKRFARESCKLRYVHMQRRHGIMKIKVICSNIK